MRLDSKILLRNIDRRDLLKVSLLTAAATMIDVDAQGATTTKLNILIGRPTDKSVALSLLSTINGTALIEYGYSKTQLTVRTKSQAITNATPAIFELTNLRANATFYYRVRFTSSGKLQLTDIYSATTQRKAGSQFSFTVQGDTHPERAGKMFNADLYKVMLTNVAAQKPDFHIMLGDDFSIDPLISKGAANKSSVENIYRTQRDWLTTIGSSIPIFLVNGNHEQAAGYLLDGTQTNPAVLAGSARVKYFPLPESNATYSVDTTSIDGVGLLRDYYAWEWGDALFVTLDPYWHSKFAVDNVAGDSASDLNNSGTKKSGGKSSNGKVNNLWQVGIGDEQYSWLKKTLEESKAKFKFVFAHHVLGTGRGAIEVSTNYEWGGQDPKGISTFQKERPNWELPIHDLMVKNGVSIFFQGHDHIFVTQERDGLIYQSMPNPADDTFSYFNESAYLSGTKAPNSGHVRVTVSSKEAKVEYFLAARSADTSRANLALAHSYTVIPRA
mgnify:FL=1